MKLLTSHCFFQKQDLAEGTWSTRWHSCQTWVMNIPKKWGDTKSRRCLSRRELVNNKKEKGNETLTGWDPSLSQSELTWCFSVSSTKLLKNRRFWSEGQYCQCHWVPAKDCQDNMRNSHPEKSSRFSDIYIEKYFHTKLQFLPDKTTLRCSIHANLICSTSKAISHFQFNS